VTEPLHLSCATDRHYLGHAATMVRSALANAGAEVVVHVLHGPELPHAELVRLQAMCADERSEIVLHEIDPVCIAGLPVKGRFGGAMWYRTLLPELLPDVSRILYLDVDTLVLNRLEPLFELDLGSNYLAAVANVFMEFHRYRLAQLGFEPGEYFNSGVLLLNLSEMREGEFAERVREAVQTSAGPLEWPDQDALNLVSRDRWHAVHPRWNSMNSLRTRPSLADELFGARSLAEAVRDPTIRHFEGPEWGKPWHVLHERDGRRLYRRYREATPWPSYPLEGGGVRNHLRRLMRDARGRSRVR